MVWNAMNPETDVAHSGTTGSPTWVLGLAYTPFRKRSACKSSQKPDQPCWRTHKKELFGI